MTTVIPSWAEDILCDDCGRPIPMGEFLVLDTVNESITHEECPMQDRFNAENRSDQQGRPAGGSVSGVGLHIDWQDGPLGRDDERLEPNGAFVETVIAAAKQRIEYYNETEFRCRENSMAITKLDEALLWLNKRTTDRETRGVEGTHEQ